MTRTHSIKQTHMGATPQSRKSPPKRPPDSPGPNHTVLRELSRLPDLTIAELKDQYKSLFGKPPPFHTQAFLIKRIAYRLQEIAHGGVSEAAHLKMTALLQKHGMASDGFPAKHGNRGTGGTSGDGKNGPATVAQGISHLQGLHPGTVLRREWDGVTHEVRVERDGFVWQGVRYQSLSRIAKVMTGTSWNGPRFFGLRPKAKSSGQGGGAE